MKNRIVSITKEDIKNAGSYCDNGGCLLATAMKREGYTGISCGPGYVSTSEGSFTFSKRAERKIFRSYPGDPNNRGDILGGVTPRKDAKPFQVILHPRP